MRAHRRGRNAGALGAALAGALLAWNPCAFALDPALDVSQYAHTSWKSSEGFPKDTTRCIAQTADGYLWLGTDFGLLRFDGVRSVPWKSPSEQHLPSSQISSLLAAGDGTLWIGTAKGLASWKGGKLTQYPDLAGQRVTRILQDREGAIWVGGVGLSSGRLCTIRNGTVQCSGEDGQLGAGVLSLYEDRQGNLWVGTLAGLWRWKPSTPTRYPMPTPTLRELIEGDDGALWIAMRDGIIRFVNGKGEPYPLPFAGQFSPDRMLRDRDGGLWIGTHGQGLLHLHQGKTDVFGSADGLSGDVIYGLFEDREGNIWVTTSEGIDRFRAFAVPTVSSKQGLSGTIGSVLAARDGSVWFGTSDGLDRWNEGQLTIYRKRAGHFSSHAAQPGAVREISDDGLPDSFAGSLFQDNRGRIWVSTPGGIAYFEDGRFTPVRSAPSRTVHSIVEEGAGNFWIADEQQGLFHLPGWSGVERILWAKMGHEDSAGTMTADPVQGGLWLGFYRGGLVYWRDGQVRASYAAASGLGDGRVNSLQMDGEGTLWAATDGGLSRLKNGRMATLTAKNGLPCDAVHSVVEDDTRSLWLYMQCGIVRIGRPELDAWVADSQHTIHVTVFDSSDGVRLRAEAWGYSPHAAKSTDGKLWFVATGGVSVIDPSHLAINPLPPPVHVEQVTADGKTSEVSPNLRLPSLVRDVSIEYTALSFAAPEKVHFRYMLEGQDRDWTEVLNQRSVHYSNLAPRNYRFRVAASNNSGVWNEAGAFLDFSVAPAYYQTAWFQALCGAAFLTLLWGIYRLRLRYVAQQFNMRLEERVNERTRIARDFHDTLLQSFQGVLLKFSSVTYMLSGHPEAREKLQDVIEQARDALIEGRDAVQGLRSSTVVTNDLVNAITGFGEQLAAEHSADQAGCDCPEFLVRAAGPSRNLAPLVRDEVHRIACEAVRNAFRHAQASRIEAEIHYGRRQLRLRVVDNGKGIDQLVAGEGRRPGHFGLPGMQERAKLVGGELALLSRRDSGTEVELTIPAALAYIKSPVAARPTSLGKGA